MSTAIAQGTARDGVEAALARIAEHDGLINAFTAVTAERARATADRLDAAAPAPLAGMPFAVKNLFDVAGLPTLAGSRINRDRPPAARDAFLVRRMEQAGGVLLGALNMGEYAYDFTGENAHDGASRNPRDPERMTGGSSGGSAAAVAAGMVPVALGSDTNGSIRVPASLCGLFGLKPTYGRLSRAGTFPFVSSFDHLGPLARNVTDLARVHDALQGADPEDPMQAARPVEPVLPELERGIAGLRIAVAGGYFARGGHPEAFAAVAAAARALGATTVVEFPEAHRARAAAYVITAAEGAALHAARLRDRAAGFDPEVRDRLIAGLAIPAAWVAWAQRFRRWYQARVAALFRDVDVVLAPATPVRAPLLGQKTLELDGATVPLRPNLGLYTQPISFIGLPVVAVPLWPDAGLPIGVQVIAAPWREDLALRVARVLERGGVAHCG
ncbi:AtzE family amidohydrolase [Roseomonas sp. KE0001]|uniref:AtzE family amidohydrolase n=1 Tax=Roseomonas sp. KE0001 TaxID=2479201 RepID=UPI0018DF10DF|nr:AtzE family amidohydrolase [Roseomonas sp. KE0001]MBI0435890.1 AtzE family amidohydrolase [Roseomonas sp. KE0001]